MHIYSLKQVANNPCLLFDKPDQSIHDLSKSEKKELAKRINIFIEEKIKFTNPTTANITDLKTLVSLTDLTKKKGLWKKLSSTKSSSSKTVTEFQKTNSSLLELLGKDEKDESPEGLLVDNLNKNKISLVSAIKGDDSAPLNINEVSQFLKSLGSSKNDLTRLNLTEIKVEPENLKDLVKMIKDCPNLSLITLNRNFPRGRFYAAFGDLGKYMVVDDKEKNLITIQKILN